MTRGQRSKVNISGGRLRAHAHAERCARLRQHPAQHSMQLPTQCAVDTHHHHSRSCSARRSRRRLWGGGRRCPCWRGRGRTAGRGWAACVAHAGSARDRDAGRARREIARRTEPAACAAAAVAPEQRDTAPSVQAAARLLPLLAALPVKPRDAVALVVRAGAQRRTRAAVQAGRCGARRSFEHLAPFAGVVRWACAEQPVPAKKPQTAAAVLAGATGGCLPCDIIHALLRWRADRAVDHGKQRLHGHAAGLPHFAEAREVAGRGA